MRVRGGEGGEDVSTYVCEGSEGVCWGWGWMTAQAHSVFKCFALYVIFFISSSSQGSKNVLKEFFVS